MRMRGGGGGGGEWSTGEIKISSSSLSSLLSSCTGRSRLTLAITADPKKKWDQNPIIIFPD